MMKKLYLSPYIFFLLKEGKTIIWDYKHHRQYELKEEYYERLKILSQSKGYLCEEYEHIDKDLLEANLVSFEPYEVIDWKWDELGLIYHIGTQDVSGEDIDQENDDNLFLENYIQFCEEIAKDKEYSYISYEGDQVKLLRPNLEKLNNTSILESFKNRMTSRSFNGERVSLEDFSTLLFTSFGLIHGDWEELKNKNLRSLGVRKAHPSGGGMHPVEAYIIVFNVENTPAGIYHYNVKGHHLNKIADVCTYECLKRALCGQFFVEGISFGIFLVAHFSKVCDKYVHSRSYKDVYLDAGHVSQTFLLSATSLSLLTWESAWFKDSSVCELLKINGTSVSPMFFLGVGYGEKIAVPKKLENYINDKKNYS